MDCYLKTWGLYQWFEEHGRHLIHPHDLDSLIQLQPHGKIFYCDLMHDDYLVLHYCNKQFRVKPELFKPLPCPPINIGDNVVTNDKCHGQIIDMTWHFQRNEYMFFLKIKGKIKSKRYWLADFASS